MSSQWNRKRLCAACQRNEVVHENAETIEELTLFMVREKTTIGTRLAMPEHAARAARELIDYPDRELFGVLNVDTRNRIVAYHPVSVGSLNGSLVHAREVFKTAILDSAAAGKGGRGSWALLPALLQSRVP